MALFPSSVLCQFMFYVFLRELIYPLISGLWKDSPTCFGFISPPRLGKYSSFVSVRIINVTGLKYRSRQSRFISLFTCLYYSLSLSESIYFTFWLGWRVASVVNSDCCSCKGLGFHSQHPHGGLQPFVSPVSGN